MLASRLTLACAFALTAISATAEQSGAEQSGAIGLELNAATQEDTGCRLSFLVQNELEADIKQLALEAVLFDAQGQVSQLTLLDFAALPKARPRVRQFIIANTQCSAISRLLINGASACTGEGLTPASCEQALKPSSRTTIEVIG